MREKWSAMTPYRQVMLVATVGVALLFTVLYLIIGTQPGVEYGSGFFRLETQGEAKVYTGFAHEWRNGNTIFGSNEGVEMVYAVTETPEGYTVECQRGGRYFGPYQVTEYPLLEFPLSEEAKALAQLPFPLEGILEIKNVATGELLFRGGYWLQTGHAFLFDENAEAGEGGSISDYAPPYPEEGPSPYEIVHFTLGAGENLTRRGNVTYFALALLFAVLNVVFILYAEELFTWSMSFRVAEPERVEPSEWELMTRQVSWAVCLIFEVIFFFVAILSHT